MDIDTYAARNEPVWTRLDGLARRAGQHPRSLTPDELAELVTLYGRVSTHLSYVRTHFDDHQLSGRLSALVARAGASLHGTRPRARSSASAFFTSTLPAAVWQLRPFVAASAILTFLPAVLVGLWLTHSPGALHSLAPPADLRNYADQAFGDYYRSQPAIQFATHVYFNNVLVACVAFVGGVLLCVPSAYVLALNGLNLGVAAGVLTAAGKAGRFWVLVLPHGLVELTSVVVAGAAGLRLGWSWIDPGDRTRARAFVEEGRRAIVAIMGVAISLAIAGAIEGTVTGSSLPPEVRVGVGVLAEAALLTYLVAMGRRARAAGVTGSLGEEPLGGVPLGEESLGGEPPREEPSGRPYGLATMSTTATT